MVEYDRGHDGLGEVSPRGGDVRGDGTERDYDIYIWVNQQTIECFLDPADREIRFDHDIRRHANVEFT